MDWNIVSQIALIIVGLLGGAATVPVIRWLKNKLNTNGAQTLALAGVVAAVLTLATAVLDQVLLPGAVTADNFGVLFLLLFGMGQARYRQIKDELEAE